MQQDVRALLDELHADGTAHDAAQPDRLLRRRNLEPDTAELLATVLRAAAARRVVEIGTGNGYSTIWLALAARDVGGRVSTVDTQRWDGVAGNLAAAGVASVVDTHIGDGGDYLASLPDGVVDMLFLDAERVEYPQWWPHPLRVLRPGGTLAVDNVLSHPDEVAGFLDLAARSGELVGTTVPVGKGLHLSWRRAPARAAGPAPAGTGS